MAGSQLEAWFPSYGRAFPWRTWSDPYRLIVVELLLQRTRADVVASMVGAFFAKYRGWADLLQAPTDDLEADLARLGLQRRRTEVLRRLARTALASAEGAFTKINLPHTGQYQERALRVVLNGERLAMVDSNFVRVLRRMFRGPWKADYRYDRRLQELALAFIAGAREAKTANWAVLDLGAKVCVPRHPRCGICPIAQICITGTATVSNSELE
jgi:A/G-specific adenine glycosylase